MSVPSDEFRADEFRADELLAGVSGTPADLERAAAEDPTLRRRLADLAMIEPYLADVLAGDPAGEGFVRRVRHRLDTQTDSAKFVRTVLRRLDRPDEPPETARLPVFPPPSGLRRAPESNHSAAWAILGIAATLALATGLVLLERSCLGPGREHPAPAPTAAVTPVPPQQPTESTAPAVAVVEHVNGRLIAEGDRALRVGDPVLYGSPAATPPGSSAVLRRPDGTRLEIAGGTRIDRFADGPDGLRIELAVGAVSADVRPQPVGRPLRVTSPHAEAVVLGTRLSVDASAAATRLEVRTGRVRLVRRRDGAALEVPAGHGAAVSPDAEFAVRPLGAAVTGFTLIDADTGRAVGALADGERLDRPGSPNRRTIRAEATDSVRSVRFLLDGRFVRTESVPPFLLGGDTKGEIKHDEFAPGEHRLTAVPYPEIDARGEPGLPLTLTFRVQRK